jgi:hypothetical protein
VEWLTEPVDDSAGRLGRGYRDRVRWHLLFADLEAFADASERAAFDGEIVDRGRAERAAIGLVDRLAAHVGAVLSFRLLGGERIRGRVDDVGADWLLLDDGASVLLPLAAVAGVEGLSRRAAADGAGLARRVRLTVLLRRLSRDRAGVLVQLTDGSGLSGTIDRVGADHLDVALHPAGEFRRSGEVRGVCVVPVAAIGLVRSADG